MNDETPALENGEEQAWAQLGERLRGAREYLGLSQEDVAEHMGLSRPAISNVESGKRKVSTFELTRFAQLYRRPYEYFLGETDELVDDEVSGALFRTAQELSDSDKEQVLRFAQFLRGAGQAPEPEAGGE